MAWATTGLARWITFPIVLGILSTVGSHSLIKLHPEVLVIKPFTHERSSCQSQ